MRGMAFRDLCEMDLAFCVHGLTPKPPIDTFDEARQRFPGADTAERLARVEKLKTEFLLRHPEPEPDVGPYWAKYQQVFSEAGLASCEPKQLKDFANNSIGAHPGNMSVFNNAWNSMGETEAARRTRAAIHHLL